MYNKQIGTTSLREVVRRELQLYLFNNLFTIASGQITAIEEPGIVTIDNKYTRIQVLHLSLFEFKLAVGMNGLLLTPRVNALYDIQASYFLPLELTKAEIEAQFVLTGDTNIKGNLNVEGGESISTNLDVSGAITCSEVTPANGATGVFVSADNKAITVTSGIITEIVPL